jgi:glycosyltransferase involved in cell wall biosynthesis
MLGAGETGNETYLRGILGGLDELGFRALVAVPGPDVAVGAHAAVVLPRRSDLARLTVDLTAIARDRRAQVIHSTYAAPFVSRAASVLTVHDVSFLRHPEWFGARDLMVLNAGVRVSAPRAARVLVPSRHVRDEVCGLLGVSPERVVVTPEGVDERFRPLWDAASRERAARLLLRLGVHTPYVFAVGNLQPRKNLVRLVEAWALLCASGAADGYRLVVAGGFRGRRDGAPALAVALGIGDRVVFPGFVGDDELPALYGAADLFVHPSLHEGFGLTTLEAMACGTPVACSNVTSLPEVTDGAAAVFDPKDSADVAAVLGALLADEGLRDRLRARGLRRASRASWRACAELTAAAYETAAHEAACGGGVGGGTACGGGTGRGITVAAAAPAGAGARP